MNRFKTVFMFEYFGYLKNKSFIAVTVILAALALLVPFVPTVMGYLDIGGGKREPDMAAVYDTAGRFDAETAGGYFEKYSFDVSDNLDDSLAMLSDGGYKMVLYIDGLDYKIYVNSLSLTSFDLKISADRMVTDAGRQDILGDSGFSENDIENFFNLEPAGEVVTVAGTADEFSYIRNSVYAYVLLFVLYFTLILYGNYVATSVVTEKSTKTMELLITSARPVHLIFGKVLGVASAGMTQFAIMLVTGFISFSVNSLLLMNLYSGVISEATAAIPNEMIAMISAPVSPLIFVYLVVFFILGFLLYAFIFAGFASTCSRMEEVNTVIMLPMLLIVAGFILSIFGLMNASVTVITVLSYVPPFIPMLMFMRVCMGSAGNIEAVIGVALLAASVYGAGVLSAKIYRMGVLMYGKTPKFTEIFKMLKQARV